MYKVALLLMCLLRYGDVSSQNQPKVIKWSELENIINIDNDTTYVLNFWATWCKPCIKKIPYFENLKSEFSTQKLEVILISLDFSDDLEKKVVPFLVENHIKNRVLLLDELNYDSWINKVDSGWQGSIPATFIFNNKKYIKKFYEREFDQQQLITTIKKILS